MRERWLWPGLACAFTQIWPAEVRRSKKSFLVVASSSCFWATEQEWVSVPPGLRRCRLVWYLRPLSIPAGAAVPSIHNQHSQGAAGRLPSPRVRRTVAWQSGDDCRAGKQSRRAASHHTLARSCRSSVAKNNVCNLCGSAIILGTKGASAAAELAAWLLPWCGFVLVFDHGWGNQSWQQP